MRGCLVEASPVVPTARSVRTIPPRGGAEDIPPALVLVANEFLDALPIRQLVRRDGAWHERLTPGGMGVSVCSIRRQALGGIAPDRYVKVSNGEIAEVFRCVTSTDCRLPDRA